jgi:hypothetical protein
MTKLGQLQTAITGVQPGSSENKKTVLQLRTHYFPNAVLHTHMSVSLVRTFGGGGVTTKNTAAKLAHFRRMEFADHIPNNTFIKMH